MAYDPSVPPSLITQGIGGTEGLRWFALTWIDPIADVLAPGYISNAEDIGMRAGDGLIYKDTNRGEWDHYDLIVASVDADGAGTVAFPEVPEEAMPLSETVDGNDPDTYFVMYQAGRQVRVAAADAPSPQGGLYDLAFRFSTAPVGGEVMDFLVAGRAFQFAANFAGSVGFVHTPPASALTFTIKSGGTVADNGTTIGTIAVGTDGAFTFATAGGTSKAIAAGTLLKFIAPAVTDEALSGMAVTLFGSIS